MAKSTKRRLQLLPGARVWWHSLRVSPQQWHAALQQAVELYERGAFADAGAVCRRLLTRGPDPVVFHLQGVLALAMGDLERAHEVLERALELAPDSVDVLVCLGLVAVQAGRIEVGLERCRRALDLDPQNRAALSGFGAALQQKGDLLGAHAAFVSCVAAHPGFVEGWCNLGGACIALGRMDEAVAAYREAVTRQPTLVAGHQGLVWVFTTTGQDALRGAAVRAWFAACPQDPTASHLARALGSGEPPLRCEPTFIAQYFDAFARTYDVALQNLGTAVAGTLAAIWRDGKVESKCTLDVGCGTGAGSAWLASPGRRIIGVDLSPAMLAQARGTGLYDELHCDDAMTFLDTTKERFDAVVLADVLPYFGDLEPLLRAVTRCLAAGGHVLASFEVAGEPGYHLAPTGRFQHHAEEVVRAAMSSGLATTVLQSGVLRQEGGRPVDGWYVLWRRRDR